MGQATLKLLTAAFQRYDLSAPSGVDAIRAILNYEPKDLEASRSLAESNTRPSPVEQALHGDRKERTVAHSGRGGAGNTYNPSELSQTGKYSSAANADDDARGNDGAAFDVETGAPMRGRGGAGNFAPRSSVTEGKEVEALSGQGRAQAPDTLSQIEEDVEKALTKPDAVHLRPKERRTEAPLGSG